MLVSLSRLAFDSLDDAGLAWACIEPTIRRIRGRKPAVKAEVYAQLTVGQRALLMYWVLRGHTQNGVAQFFGEVGYLLPDVDVWSALRSAMAYFGDDDMRRVVEEMARLWHTAAPASGGGASEGHAWEVGGDPSVAGAVNRLDRALVERASSTLARVGARIRLNPGEFVRFSD